MTISFAVGNSATTPTPPTTPGDVEDYGDFTDTLVITRPGDSAAAVTVSGTLVWNVGRDPGTNAEDELVDLTFTTSQGVFADGNAVNSNPQTVTIKDADPQSYVLSLPTGVSSITEGAAATTLTLEASPVKTVDLTGIAFAMAPNDLSKYTLVGPAIPTLPFNTNSVTATIQALADGNRVEDTLTVTAYGGSPLATLDTLDISVKDIHELPATADITMKAYNSDKADKVEVMTLGGRPGVHRGHGGPRHRRLSRWREAQGHLGRDRCHTRQDRG